MEQKEEKFFVDHRNVFFIPGYVRRFHADRLFLAQL
jgi:hypothetical protein